MKTENQIRKIFRNLSDCYADNGDGPLIPAMTEDHFVEAVKECGVEEFKVESKQDVIEAIKAISDLLHETEGGAGLFIWTVSEEDSIASGLAGNVGDIIRVVVNTMFQSETAGTLLLSAFQIVNEHHETP
jgi:hypothetical protein